MPTLRILIADDHEIVRQGLRSLLQSRPGWEVCGEAADGWEAVTKAAELHPDVVALDVGMPNLNGLDAARQILRNDPRQKILFLTIYESEQLARSVSTVGAKGLILKSDAGKDLITAVEALQRNGTFFNTRMAQALGSDLRGNHRHQEKDVLTRRERQVVQLLAEGKMTDGMASLAKMNNARMAREVVADAREMLGGNGILLEYQIARHHADIEAVFTYEGTDTVQSLIVGREVTGMQAFAPSRG